MLFEKKTLINYVQLTLQMPMFIYVYMCACVYMYVLCYSQKKWSLIGKI